MQNIGILGGGWLGQALARFYSNKGKNIRISTTTSSKVETFTSNGWEAFVLQLQANAIEGDFDVFLSNLDVLIINIPPSKAFGKLDVALQQWIQNYYNLLTFPVIWISSTSVFEDAPNFPIYTEDDVPNGSDFSSQVLIRCEQQIASLYNPWHIIRLGGLLGADRHPIKFLSGRNDVPNPNAPVNLIVQEDVVLLIDKILQSKLANHIWHGVHPMHPKRMEFYTQAAEKRNLEIPIFSKNNTEVGKWISGEKTQEILGFQYTKEIHF